MKLSPLALLIFLLAAATLAQAQTIGRRDRAATQVIEDATADQVVAARAIFLLKRLDDDVIVYRSLGEFEESGKLSRVSFETFKSDLRQVSEEVEAITSRLPSGRLQKEIRNTLASYQDGMFWWQQIYQPQVIQISSLREIDRRTPADSFLLTNAPYTVAIYWRLANKYLQRAARDIFRD